MQCISQQAEGRPTIIAVRDRESAIKRGKEEIFLIILEFCRELYSKPKEKQEDKSVVNTHGLTKEKKKEKKKRLPR